MNYLVNILTRRFRSARFFCLAFFTHSYTIGLRLKRRKNMIGLRNVVIDGQRSRIVFEGKQIFYICGDEGPLASDIAWTNGKRCQAFPATIDIHDHDRWGESAKEDPEHLEVACYEGGVGTIITMPNTIPAYVRADQAEIRLAGFSKSNLTVLAWGGTTRDNFQERLQMLQYSQRRTPGFKLAMASTTNPATLIDDYVSQRRILEENAVLNALTLVHAEAEDWINASRAEIQAKIANAELGVEDHCRVRASEVEVEGIRRILQAHYEIRSQAPIHICHLSTVGGLNEIIKAKNRGQLVTCEVCPHYLVFNESMLRGVNGGFYKMNPSLRPPREQNAMVDALCNGEIDMVASDHAPHKKDEKKQTLLDKCPSGVPGVQTLTLLVYHLMSRGLITAERYVELTSANAAKLVGLKKGKLAIGYDGDVVLIDPNESTLFTNQSMKYKCGWTPFHGMHASGKIRMLILGGKIVKEDMR